MSEIKLLESCTASEYEQMYLSLCLDIHTKNEQIEKSNEKG